MRREDGWLWHSHTGIHTGGTRGPRPRPMLESWPHRRGNVIVLWGSSLSGALFDTSLYKHAHTKEKKRRYCISRVYTDDGLGMLLFWGTHTHTHTHTH